MNRKRRKNCLNYEKTRRKTRFPLITVNVLFKNKIPSSSRVSPTAVPPLRKLEGTHGVRSAWGHTDAIDFVAIASSLQATNGIRDILQYRSAESRATALCAPGVAINTAQSLVLRTQGLPLGKNKRTCACISKMEAKFFAVWEEEHKEPRRTTATCCG